jgi:hypothetical protein
MTGAQAFAQATRLDIDSSVWTGTSTIDDTTKKLVTTLEKVVDSFEFIPCGSPQAYGIAVHKAFEFVVKA